MTSAPPPTPKTEILLLSSDEEEYKVPRAVALMSVTVKSMLEDIGELDAPVPLPNVSGKVLAKVIDYCKHHVDNPSPRTEEKKDERRLDDILPWDADYIKVDQAMLFDLILAANYLDIKPLLDLGCKTVAGMIKGKMPEEIRKTFNIKNDFTPEEEETVRKENEWCEEK